VNSEASLAETAILYGAFFIYSDASFAVEEIFWVAEWKSSLVEFAEAADLSYKFLADIFSNKWPNVPQSGLSFVYVRQASSSFVALSS